MGLGFRAGPCLLDLGHAAGQAVEHALVLAHAVQAVPRHALPQALQQRRNTPLHRNRGLYALWLCMSM